MEKDILKGIRLVGCSTDRLRKDINEIVEYGKDRGDPPDRILVDITREMDRFGERCDGNICLISGEIRDLFLKLKREK